VPIGIGTRSGSWSKDGNLLIGSPGDWTPIFLFDVRGGNAVTVTNLEPGQTTHAYPYFLPDGRHFLFFSRTTDSQGIYVGSLDSKETHRLFDSDSAAVFSPPDYVLFARRGALLAQRLDLKTMSPAGAAISLSPEVFVDTSTGSTSVRGGIAASASAAGPIAYRAHGDRTQLGWVDRAGRLITLIPGTEHADIRQAADLSLAPDGHTAAFARTVDGNKDLWLIDLDRGLPRRFTSNKAWDGLPIWSPDGKRLVFSTLRKGVLDLYQRPADETEPETPLMESGEGKIAHDWSMDGRYILYQSSNPQTSDDIWAMPLFGDRKPAPVVRTASLECCPNFSPDGHAVAYQSWETGRSEIYVQPFMGTTGKQRISSEGGAAVRWRADGKELFYRSLDGRLMAVAIQQDGKAIKAGTPSPLFRVPVVYLPSPDGQRFLVNVVTEPAAPITILLNWKRPAK
jgi:eukaryotic-like serine/threonine-protein kinase